MTEYQPHKIRSRPFRFISLPILVMFLFIFYWLMLTPLLYVFILHEFDSHVILRYAYWIILLAIFVILLIVLITIWRCKREESNENVVIRQSEYNTLLRETHCSFNKEVNACVLENFVEHNAEGKCDLERADFCARETMDSELLDAPETSMQEKIDRALVETREKVVKRRPKTLHIDTSCVNQKQKRFSSPLSPREIFFFDLIQSANKQRNSVTDGFLENERKLHSDVDHGTRAENRTSNSEYFIMNVGDKLTSCTAEAFIYVEEKSQPAVLQIRKESGDDDVFLAN